PSPSPARVRPVRLPSGEEALADAGGHLVPLRRYRRIVSTTMLADRLLAELAEPDRVLAFSAAGARASPWPWRYAGKPAVDGRGGARCSCRPSRAACTAAPKAPRTTTCSLPRA